MDQHQKPTRIKMGLLRQKQIEQSTEKTPLLQRDYESNSSIDTINDRQPRIEKEISTVASRVSIEKESHDSETKSHDSETKSHNTNGQKVVTLHRGLLHNEWSSSTSLEGGNPLDEIKDTQIDKESHMDVTKGILLSIFGAGIMYGLTGVFVRLAGENGVGSVETLFVRSAVQSVIFGTLAAVKKIAIRPPDGRVWSCVLVAVMYCLATISSFEAFDVIPPGNAIAIRGASRTIFAIILAFLLAQEKIFPKDIAAVVICISGISLIIASSLTSNADDYVVPVGMKDNRAVVNAYGYVLIVFAGVTRSLGMITVRRMKGELHSFTIVFYHSTLTLVVTFCLLFVRPFPWPPSAEGICYTLAVCVTSSVATWSSNYAVQLIHPGLVALGQNSDMVVSIVLGHIILHLAPSALEILGAVLILGGVCGIAFLKWRESKKENS